MPDGKTVVLKISGESLAGVSQIVEVPFLHRIISEIKLALEVGFSVALVVGGGNIWRGRNTTSPALDDVASDNMGMLSTMINAIALQDVAESLGICTRVMSAIEIPKVSESFIRRKALKHLSEGRLVIFSCGIGHPYFSTDMAAVLRAVEIRASRILKATNVDAVYSKDPKIHQNAIKYHTLSRKEAMQKELSFMDVSALSFANEHSLDIRIFDIFKPNNVYKAIIGENIGTLIH